MQSLGPTDYWIFVLTFVDLIAKGFALWAAARNKQRNWFIVLLVLNTAGLLPAIYLKYFQRKR